jgi:hypothetical protein
MDPVGPVEVAAPHGLDSMVVYGDKRAPRTCRCSSTSRKSEAVIEAAGGRRKTKDLLAEELNFREHDDVSLFIQAIHY